MATGCPATPIEFIVRCTTKTAQPRVLCTTALSTGCMAGAPDRWIPQTHKTSHWLHVSGWVQDMSDTFNPKMPPAGWYVLVHNETKRIEFVIRMHKPEVYSDRPPTAEGDYWSFEERNPHYPKVGQSTYDYPVRWRIGCSLRRPETPEEIALITRLKLGLVG